MTDILKKIVARKTAEVKELKQKLQTESALRRLAKNNIIKNKMQDSLAKPGLSIIGEIKRKSPSKGVLCEIKDPCSLATTYIKGGVDAISVLTDKEFFSGSVGDLQAVAKLAQLQQVPVLRKDFIIDEVQITEAVIAGADAILLIVAVLGDKTSKLLTLAHQLGIEAIVEVHHQEELDVAITAGAKIVGINNRNLNTFNVDINVGIDLVKHVPEGIVKVSESGVSELDDLRRIKEAGFDAVLIGEALVKSKSPDLLIRKMKEL